VSVTHSQIYLIGFVFFCLIAGESVAKEFDLGHRPMPHFFKPSVYPYGISYSAYRDGESPGQSLTSKQHILEDLKIISERYRFIRLYGSGKQAENILEVIQTHQLPLYVMQGAWLDGNAPDQNEQQITSLIQLSNQYQDIIFAVNVGNEVLVDWSAHRFDNVDTVLSYVKRVRHAIHQPVTVSDDYNFWNKPAARLLARHIDFICLHAYAFWNNQSINDALAWTSDTYQSIVSLYPDKRIAFCETGWPTSRIYNDGSYEGGLIGEANEENQRVFYKVYNQWVTDENIMSFYFSSFDENWKGGFDGPNPMQKAEKHWGIYNEDRVPKAAVTPTDRR